MAKKPVKRAERVEVVYDKKRWDLLRTLRSVAMQTIEALERSHLLSIVHGSVARGDASKESDVDVFLPGLSSSFLIETVLERSGFLVTRRFVTQATPLYAIKGYIQMGEKLCISFPLVKLRQVEKDLYKFSGEASLDTLRKDIRVPGVDKRLMLIEPTANGHVESAVVGREENVAQFLRVSLNTVLDRVHALLRRDEVGRTGIFIEREVGPDETFEMVLKKLSDQNPAVRRRLKLSEK